MRPTFFLNLPTRLATLVFVAVLMSATHRSLVAAPAPLRDEPREEKSDAKPAEKPAAPDTKSPDAKPQNLDEEKQRAEAEKKKKEDEEKKRRDEAEKKKQAEEKKKKEEEQRRQQEKEFIHQLDVLREREARRAVGQHEKNHESIRKAFRDSVMNVRTSTVVVLADGVQAALGTVVDRDGFILTKASELRGNLEVRFSDGKKIAAKVTGVSEPHDVALLKVERNDLTPVKWAKSLPDLGSWLATSSVNDLPLAVGVVSVGVRTLRPRGILGIALKIDADKALIEQVIPGSPAAKIGLLPNDVVMKVEDTAITTSQQLMELLRDKQPGDKVQLMVQRGDEAKEFAATLGAEPTMSPDRQSRFHRMNLIGGDLSSRRTNFPQALQHDTVLKPEDCGGPVVNLDGETVGINIARSGRIESYALTSSLIVPLVEELKSGKLAPDAKFTQSLKLKAFDFKIAQQEKSLRAGEREKAAAEKKIADAQKAIEKAKQERDTAAKQKP